MTIAASLRSRFLDDGTAGAAPHVMLVRLFDKLLVDLGRGAAALRSGDRVASHNALINAQAILNALTVGLDDSVWDGAERLRAVYAFLLTELAQANVKQDAERVDACFAIVQPLREAWGQAASTLVLPATEAPVQHSLPMGGMTA